MMFIGHYRPFSAKHRRDSFFLKDLKYPLPSLHAQRLHGVILFRLSKDQLSYTAGIEKILVFPCGHG